MFAERVLVRPLRSGSGLARAAGGAALAWALFAACVERPAVVLVTIDAPPGVAANAVSFAIGFDADTLPYTIDRGANPYPLNLSLSSDEVGERSVYVEARDALGKPVGRGRSSARFSRSGTPTATVILTTPCAAATDCDDASYCNGVETCHEYMCVPGTPPCGTSFPCVSSACEELGGGAGRCVVAVDNRLCLIEGPQTHYCDTTLGCVPGTPCEGDDAECDDGAFCNGEERCVDAHCEGGVAPPVADGDPCTVDGCSDERAASGASPIFHVADAGLDGNICNRVAESAGICIAARGGCVTSVCGDEFTDVFNEECDDGDAGTSGVCAPSCRLNVCGDGYLYEGVEACDDRNVASGDGCRADCGKVEVCGDGVVDDAEPCDDGNSNANDGCDAVGPATCRRNTWTPELAVGLGPSGGDPLSEFLADARGVAVDRTGNLYISDTNRGRVLKIDPAGVLTLVAGKGLEAFAGDGGPATAASLLLPYGIVLDGAGNLFIADSGNVRVRKVCSDGVGCVIGTVSTVPGSTAAGETFGLALDGTGNLLLGTRVGVSRLCIDGVDCVPGSLTRVAGGTASGFAGEDVPATSALLGTVHDIERDPAGNLYVADSQYGRVRKICRDGLGCVVGNITTVAGNGAPVTFGGQGDGGPAVEAPLGFIGGLLLDDDGNLLVAEGARVRRVCLSGAGCALGTISTLAGGGSAGDGGSALEARLTQATGLALGTGGSLYIADYRRVRRVCREAGCGANTISTVAGGVGAPWISSVPATRGLTSPESLTVDANGNVIIADGIFNRVVGVCRAIDGSCIPGRMWTIAGTGLPGSSGDGGPATDAELSSPAGVVADADNNVYVSEGNRVRRICRNAASGCTLGHIDLVAGTGAQGSAGDGQAARLALLSRPRGLAFDSGGDLYIAETLGHRIRRVCLSGDGCVLDTIATVAGTGMPGFSFDGDVATNAPLSSPQDIAFDDDDDLYIADSSNDRVRRVCFSGVGCTAGTIETVAGGGSGGDGGPAISAEVRRPRAVAIDAGGNLWILPFAGHAIRKVCADGFGCTLGNIDTVAGNTTVAGFAGDGGPLADALLRSPTDVAIDGARNVLFADGNGMVRQLCLDGVGCPLGSVTSIAGAVFPTGDGSFERADLGSPLDMTWLDSSLAFVVDGAGWVRRVDTTAGQVTTVAGYTNGFAPGTDPLERAHYAGFDHPSGIVALPTATGAAILLSERGTHALARIRADDLGAPLTWTIEPYAGALGEQGHVDGPLASSRFAGPSGMLFDAERNAIYVADTANHVIRAIDLSDETVATIAGVAGTYGSFGDGDEGLGVDALTALFREPTGLALGPGADGAPGGALYIADTGNNRVRRLDFATQRVALVIGTGEAASSGDGSPARYFSVDAPRGLAVDKFGNLFVSSRYAIREVYAGADGVADGDDEVRTIYGVAPRREFPQSATVCLSGLSFAPGDAEHDELNVLDACLGLWIRLRRVPEP